MGRFWPKIGLETQPEKGVLDIKEHFRAIVTFLC